MNVLMSSSFSRWQECQLPYIWDIRSSPSAIGHPVFSYRELNHEKFPIGVVEHCHRHTIYSPQSRTSGLVIRFDKRTSYRRASQWGCHCFEVLMPSVLSSESD